MRLRHVEEQLKRTRRVIGAARPVGQIQSHGFRFVICEELRRLGVSRRVDLEANLETRAALVEGLAAMKVSRTMAYALHAMLQLARVEGRGPVPGSQLAHEGRMPLRFLLQVLRSLVNQGLLKSTRGAEGGYALARPAKSITLMDIVDAVDNPLVPSAEPLEDFPDESRRELLESLTRADGAARRELEKLTLADLLKAETANGTNTAGSSAGV